MKKARGFFLVMAIAMTIIAGLWVTMRTAKWVQFEINCTQYLKRAADANTVETAKEELAKAIFYAEEKNLTEGVVSIFLHQPKNDIGYWYQNMVEAHSELEKISDEATALEKTNVLMKLRETLTDDTESGTEVTIPNGISIYPNNVLYFWWGTLSWILCIVFWLIVDITRYKW